MIMEENIKYSLYIKHDKLNVLFNITFDYHIL